MWFQITRWQEYEKGHYQKKRPETVERHSKLSKIVTDFKNMPEERQIQHLFKTAIEIGFLMVGTRAKKWIKICKMIYIWFLYLQIILYCLLCLPVNKILCNLFNNNDKKLFYMKMVVVVTFLIELLLDPRSFQCEVRQIFVFHFGEVDLNFS